MSKHQIHGFKKFSKYPRGAGKTIWQSGVLKQFALPQELEVLLVFFGNVDGIICIP